MMPFPLSIVIIHKCINLIQSIIEEINCFNQTSSHTNGNENKMTRLLLDPDILFGVLLSISTSIQRLF